MQSLHLIRALLAPKRMGEIERLTIFLFIAGDKFLAGGVAMKVEVSAGLNIIGAVSAGPLANLSTQKDSVRKMQDRAQDQHQEGFHSSLSNAADKMVRPGGN